MEKIKNHKKEIIIIGIILVLLIGVSYGWLKVIETGKKNIGIKLGKFDIELVEEEGGPTLTSEIPITDEEGKKGEAYRFYLQNNSKEDVSYILRLVDNEEKKKECEGCNFIESKNIRYELIRKGTEKVDSLDESRKIDMSTLKRGAENRVEYELRIWIKEEAGNEAMGGVFYGKIEVEGIQMIRTKRANEPVLGD